MISAIWGVLSCMAQSFSESVALQREDGPNVILRAVGIAPKSKEAQTEAIKNAFMALFYEGVPGLKNAVPMMVGQNRNFDDRFFSTQYINYLSAEPIKISEDKFQGQRRVLIELTTNTDRLKKAIASGGCSLSPVWKEKVEAASMTSQAPMAALKPSIVVIPYVPDAKADFEAMADYLTQDPAARSAITAVASRFGNHGYVTKDFMTLLQNSEMGALTSSGTQSDIMSDIVRQLPGDIIVTVDAIKNKDGEYSQCTINLNAVERQTGDQLASQRFVSGRYKIDDAPRLAAHAVEMMKDDFFSQLDQSFKRRIDEGLSMVMEFQLGESVSDWDFDMPFPSSKDDFKSWLSDWLRDHSQDRAYDRSLATDKFIRASIKIPLWDSDSNRPYGPDSFASQLKKAIRKALADEYDVKVTEMGQRLIVTIN